VTEETEAATRRSVRLPFDFGQRVYHRARLERMPGIVVGFIVLHRDLKILVKWAEDARQDEHWFYELTTEFEPFKEES